MMILNLAGGFFFLLQFLKPGVDCLDVIVGGSVTGADTAPVIDAAKSIAARDFGVNLRVHYRPLLNYSRDPITFEREVCALVSGGNSPVALVLNDEVTPLALTMSPEPTLDTIGEVFQLPMLVTGDVVRDATLPMPFSKSKSPVVYNVRPNFIAAVRDLVRRYNWREMLYLFDSPQGLKRARQLQYMLHALDGRHRTKIYFYALSTIEDQPLHHELRTIDKWRTANRPILGAQAIQGNVELKDDDKKTPEGTDFESVLRAVVDLSSDSKYDAFLSELKDMGMNRASYHWLLYTGNMYGLDLRGFDKGGCNITGFRMAVQGEMDIEPLPPSWYDELRKRNLVNVGNQPIPSAENPYSRMSMRSQLLFDALISITRAAERSKRLGGPASSTPYSCPGAGQRAVNLTAFYQALHSNDGDNKAITGRMLFANNGERMNSSLRVTGVSYLRPLDDIGFWNQESGLYDFYIPAPNISLIAPNKTIRVVSILDTPFLRNKTSTEGKHFQGNDRFEGFCADLASKVFKMLGLQYEFHLVRDGLYGREINGTWNGMVGEILDGTADVAIAALTISSSRERVVSFTKPFLQTGISIMIKKPEKQKPGVFSFMDPLSTSIWMCIIFAYAGVSLALFLVSRFSPYEWRSMIFAPQATLQNTMWGTLGAIMQQGGNLTPHSFSGRLVASVWWFFCLILISSYTANLAAFLTVERMLTPIESAEDLARQTEIQYGTVSSGSTQEYFKNSRIELHKRMWNFMDKAKPSVFTGTTQEGVDRVLKSKGKYAFLLESLMNEYYNQRKPCNTMRVGNDLDSKGYGIATQLYSDLKDDLNDAVLKLTESGDIQELHKKWWFDKGECPGEKSGKDSSQSPLTLSNVAGIFYILITGLLCAMCSAGLEFLWNAHVHAHKYKIPLGAAMKVQARFATHGLYLMCDATVNPNDFMARDDRETEDKNYGQQEVPFLDNQGRNDWQEPGGSILEDDDANNTAV